MPNNTQIPSLTSPSCLPHYQPRRICQSHMLPVRQMHYHLRSWSHGPINPALPVLVLAHGWMDVAASWQFVVDALGDSVIQGRRIVAHDWRGSCGG